MVEKNSDASEGHDGEEDETTQFISNQWFTREKVRIYLFIYIYICTSINHEWCSFNLAFFDFISGPFHVVCCWLQGYRRFKFEPQIVGHHLLQHQNQSWSTEYWAFQTQFRRSLQRLLFCDFGRIMSTFSMKSPKLSEATIML